MQNKQTSEKETNSEDLHSTQHRSSKVDSLETNFTHCFPKSEVRPSQTCLCSTYPAAVGSHAGSNRTCPGPDTFLPCFPVSHLTAFLNCLVGKLFRKATINYSISSVLQLLKETVQSISLDSCLQCTWSPRPQSTVSPWVRQAGSL